MTVCEDWDGASELDPAWGPLAGTPAGAVRLIDRSDAPSAPTISSVVVPAVASGFATAALERVVAGPYDTARLELSWLTNAPTFPAADRGFMWLAWMRPEVGAEGPFTIGLLARQSGLASGSVATAAGGGNRIFDVGALPAAGLWTRTRIDLTVRPVWSFAAYIDDTLVASGSLGAGLVAADGLRIGFGVDVSGPISAASAGFDDVLVDLQ